MYYMHKTIDLLAILHIHKNLVPNCGMWASKYLLSTYSHPHPLCILSVYRYPLPSKQSWSRLWPNNQSSVISRRGRWPPNFRGLLLIDDNTACVGATGLTRSIGYN